MHILPLLAIVAAAPALAQDITPVSCATVSAGQLDPGDWLGGDALYYTIFGYFLGAECPVDFADLNSFVGSSCTYTNVPGIGCDSALCEDPLYDIGGGVYPGNGPEAVFSLVCPATGDVTVRLDGLDCDLDLFVLDDTFDPATGVLGFSTGEQRDAEVVTVPCEIGATRYIVVEGFGHTYDGFAGYASQDDLDLGYCFPEYAPDHLGAYEVSFDACPVPQIDLVGELAGGALTIGVVGDVMPGDRVYFGASLTGEGDGPCWGILGGGCLGVTAPVYLMENVAVDVIGSAGVTVPVPPYVSPGDSISVQAVLMRGGVGVALSDVSTVIAGIDDVF
ncbi:MAG: hypothetical protein ACI8PZ_001301 [Myxococcota bacterium]|jgi:hypothetical protein